MDKVTLVKREFQSSVWVARIGECRESGLSVVHWCRDNGINPKTYYYHLRKLREKAMEQIPFQIGEFPACSTVTKPIPADNPAAITVCAGGLSVGIADGTSRKTIEAVIHALKC